MTPPRETVLVTGASSGIGLALARCFAAEPCDVVLVARTTAALETLAAELRRQHGIRATALTADLSRPEAPGEIFAALAQMGIQVDVLVNNAGFGLQGEFTQLPRERQLAMIQVNLAALTDLTWRFLPGMIARGHGGILNVGSVAGFPPGPNMAIYFASKAYVLSFTEALAAELAGTKLKVSVLCPGPTESNFGQVARGGKAKSVATPKMTASAVAAFGHRAFRRGRVVAVPGLLNKFLIFLIWLFPRRLVRRMVWRFNRTVDC